MRNGQVVARTETDTYGRYRIHNLPAGEYAVEVRLLGFRPTLTHVTIGPEGGDTEVSLGLAPSAVRLQELEITAPVPIAVDTRSGNQVFKQDSYHGAPTQTTSQIVQQSVAGAARAPTGEVHIRGQHAEYTYYIDGVPVPAGISGSLNELFDPNVVNQITFQTGGWDAEFGNKNAAIVDVNTRIPAGGLRGDASGFGGSFSSNGQTVDASQNAGKFGWFVSGTRRESDMRQEPVVFDTLTHDPLNFHNHGTDLFAFGKAQYCRVAGRYGQSGPQLVAHPLRGALRFDRGRDPGRQPAGPQQLRQPQLAASVPRQRHGVGVGPVRRRVSPPGEPELHPGRG